MSEIEEDVLIRDFKKSDLHNLLEIANESFAEEFQIIGFDPDHIRKIVNQMFNPLGKLLLCFLKLLGKEPFRLFVAENHGRVVGTTMVNLRGRIGYITTVMVHPACRGTGIATKLMENALNHIRKKKLSKAILNVAATNSPAKGLYDRLGFRKFENAVYLIANIDSLRKPENVEEVLMKSAEKEDIDAIYDLIRCSEDPMHLKIFDFTKKDLKSSFIKRVVRFSKSMKVIAVKNNRIVGYAQASYTAAQEAGRIEDILVPPEMRLKGIEEMLIYAGAERIKKVGTNKVTVTTLLTRQELIERMKQMGFKEFLEMEAMILEF